MLRKTHWKIGTVLFAVVFVTTNFAHEGLRAQEDAISFEKQIQPIFESRCYECHSTGNVEAGLDLAIGEKAFKGGDSGKVIVPGNSKKVC